MSRGQQGIGISAAGMYGQLTTGKPVKIISDGPASRRAFFEVQIDTKKNEPLVHENKQIEEKAQGTQVTLEVEGKYQKGASVDEWLEQTTIANPTSARVPHAGRRDEGIRPDVSRTAAFAAEIKPHPYGIEFGMLLKMLQDTKSQTVSVFSQ